MTFDPQEFMNETINEVFDDAPTVIDAKEYNNAYIKPGSVTFKDGTDSKGRPWRGVSMYFYIDDEEQREKTGLEQPGAGYFFFLDLGPDGKSLATGPNRNIDLGALRKALRQESPPWNFGMLDGAGPVRIKVGHVVGKDGKVRAEVKSVARQA